jgi:hypothetical protein
MKHIFSLLLAASLTAMFIVACVDTDFDQPPTGGEAVDIKANRTIAQIRALHTNLDAGVIDTIKTPDSGDTIIISGVVVMDDRSGNYYKKLVIQDSTAGIEVAFNDADLYTRFPVGRTIYIRCNGLLLTDYEGLTQLTGGVIYEAGVPREIGLTEAQVRTRVVGGIFGDAPAPRKVKINELNDTHISTLIQLDDVEFVSSDTGKTYAEPITQTDVNRLLEDCNQKTLILRSSGFANFAGEKTPRGKGSIVGVLGIFRDDNQLYIRDLNDVKMDSVRCGTVNPNPCPDVPPVDPATPLETLNEAFNGTSTNVDVAISGWRNIKTIGSRVWRGAEFQGDKYVQATAFSSGLAAMECWMITPALNLSTQKTFSCETSWGFYVHDGLTVWVSNDFDGVNVACATWTKLDVKIAKEPDGQYNWVPSGNVNLPILSGKSYIGFKYVGNTNNQTTTWRVDDVKVQ